MHKYWLHLREIVNTEQQIDVVKKFMKHKICFGLKVEDSEVCKHCPIATQCAPMKVARLAYEKQQLEAAAAQSEVDAEFEARMENMSKAKFEAMLAHALNRQTERSFPVSNAPAAHEQQNAKRDREVERKAPLSNAIAPIEQPVVTVVKVQGKGRPRSAKEKSEQVLALAAKGMTRQAIANGLGISLASVYRILKENR